MATQTIRVCIPLEAGTYTVNAQVDGSNTDTYSARTLTNTGNPAFWVFTVTGANAGLYSFQIYDADSNPVAYGWFYSPTDILTTINDSSTREGALALVRWGTPVGATFSADIQDVKADTEGIPKAGQTHRFTQVDTGTLTVDVAISEVP